MKYAVLTLILGYITIFFYSSIEQYVLPLAALFMLIFMINLFRKRFEVLPGIVEKVNAFFLITLFTAIILTLVYFSINNNWFPIYYYPPIFALIVLSRKVVRKLINLTIREPKSFGVMSETERGETVRSKAEKKVADWLHENGYEYEYEKKINPGGNPIMTDFYLPKSDIYIEYWGMSSANNEAGEKYRERKNEKIQLYEKYNLKLISLYPHHLYELNNYIPHRINELTGTSFWARIFGFMRGSKSKPAETQTSPITENSSDQEDEPLFCTNCGNEVSKKGEFCVKCGQQA